MNKFVKLKPYFTLFVGLILLNLNIKAQEVIYLHTDKNDYISGETIQFKAYLAIISPGQNTDVSKIIYFQLTGYDKIEISGLRANVENGICIGQINIPDTLKTGYYYLSAFTNRMRNYPVETYFNRKVFITRQNDDKLDSIYDFSITNERNVMNDSMQKSNNNSANCKIYTNKYSYHPGEKIKLSIVIDSLINRSGLTNLSVSVREQSPFEDTCSTKSIISFYDYIQDEWKFLRQNKYLSLSGHLTENEGYILKGQVTGKTNNIPLSSVTVLLSSSDSIPDLQYYTTNQDGEFYYQIKNKYDNKNLFLQLNDSVNAYRNYEFKIDEKRIFPGQVSKSKMNMNISEKTYLENSQKLVLINKIYNPANQDLSRKSIEKSHEPRYPFFGMVDQIILPSDYEELANFMEMTKNYITIVKFKKNAYGYNLNIIDDETKLMQEENALFLLNSIPIFDYNALNDIEGKAIQRIELKRKHVLYGKLNFHGVISILTDPKLASKIYSELGLPSISNHVMKYSGEIPVNHNESQESQLNRIPDFRQILYWNPEVILNDGNETNIEFSASEYRTKYNIDVQGITSDNKLVFSRSTIEVK